MVLGARSPIRFGFNQPFIIRKVDERWGIDDISPVVLVPGASKSI